MLRALALTALAGAAARVTQNFDLDWLFILGDQPGFMPTSCNASSFPIDMNGIQCMGLSGGDIVSSAADCAATACMAGAETYQWCPTSGCTGGPAGSCWFGAISTCQNSTGWISGGRSTVPPTPPPPPPVCPGDRACPDYPDASWRQVTLPHDFVVEGKPDPNGSANHGYLPFNISWYRKHFDVPASWSGQPVWLDFDGVYRASDYWLNGVWVGHWDSGYAPHRWYIHNVTGAPLNYGGENVLVVRVDALSFQEGWFYEGGGIDRHVTINTAPAVNLVPWGIYVPSVVTGAISSPQGLNGAQTAASALVPVSIDIQNSGSSSGSWTLQTTIYDASGNTVGTASDSGSLAPGGWVRSVTQITLGGSVPVQLWNVVRPYLYAAAVVLTVGGVADDVNVTFGIRSAIFDANAGFLLNGLPVKIQGFSQHQDFAGVGNAVPDRVNRFRVDVLKSIGANGWRTAHNPVASELLSYMDTAGMLVWAENRNLERQVIARGQARQQRMRGPLVGPDGLVRHVFGDTPFDPATFPDPQYLGEAAAMVLRDRNHPCIVVWSLCNEGGCMQGDPLGGIVASAFKNTILNIDGSRPVTANSEDTPGDTLTRVLDIEAFSYNYGEYDTAHYRYPWKPVIGGESASCVSDRGYYGPNNSTTAHVNADDIGCVVNAWKSAGTRQWVIGSFAWTGTDYKGEPTPMQWPSINSHFGVVDIAGYPKDSAGYYRAWWLTGSTTLDLLPSTWNANVAPSGSPITIVAFTSAPTVELFVNGASQGLRNVSYLDVATWNGVTYQPGNLTAVSYDASGAVVTTTTVTTTGSAVALRLSADAGSDTIAADGQDVSLVRVEVVDAQGNVVPDAMPMITYTLSGPGVINGLGNGNPSDITPDKVGNPELPYGGVWVRTTWAGLARAIVQSSTTPGTLVLSASAPGLTPANLTITTVTVAQ